MIRKGLVEAGKIASCPIPTLESVIRSSGFYRQKARRLKEMARFVLAFAGDFYHEVERDRLLPILLYACSRERFVVDAYTRRIFERYGMLPRKEKYEEIQEFFQSRLDRDVTLYKRFHALIVEHAKQTCRKLPRCEQCVLVGKCAGAFAFPKKRGVPFLLITRNLSRH